MSYLIVAAMIDDGVHPDRFCLTGSWIVQENHVVSVNNFINTAELSHADFCMAIIQKYADIGNVHWHSIKVLEDDTKRGKISSLLKALEFCEILDAKLIHLSIGTTYYEDFQPIQTVIDRLVKKGTIIVSATSNRGVVTYPAHLSDVIGVQTCPALVEDAYRIQKSTIEGIFFCASSKHKLIIDRCEIESPESNSFAAPLITAKVISYLSQNQKLNCNEMIDLLTQDTSDCSEGDTCFLIEERANFINTKKDDLPDIPVVVLSGFDSQKLINLTNNIAACLEVDDYNYRVALNHPKAVSLGMTQMHENICLDEFACRMNSYYNCEIMLLGFTRSVRPDECRSASLWIWGCEEEQVEDYALPDDQKGIVVENETGNDIYEWMLSELL